MLQQSAARDALLFLGGLAGVFHETVIATTERPTLLILFAAMMGLPAFLGKGSDAPAPPPPSPPPSPPAPPTLPAPPPTPE